MTSNIPDPPFPSRPPKRKRLESDRYTVRLYRNDSLDVQVYTHVKHVWWQAGNSVLTVLHYYEDGTHRYVQWPREKIEWYSVELEGQ